MTKRKTNRVPLGNFQPMTDDEIDAFAGTVDVADIELLRTQWKKYASKRGGSLVDARPVEPTINGLTKPPNP